MGRSRSGRWRLAGPAGAVLAVVTIAVMLASCAAAAPRLGRAASAVAAARQLPVSVRLGGEVDGLAAGGGYVWAHVRDTGVLVRVDPRTGQARRFRFAAWRGMPVAAAAGPGGLWLANQHATRPEVIRIDPRTGRVAAPAAAARRPWPGRWPGSRLRVGVDLDTRCGLPARLAGAAPQPGHRPGRRQQRRHRGQPADRPHRGHLGQLRADRGHRLDTRDRAGLDPRTLALHTAATAYLSGGLVFGGGRAWALSAGAPRLAVVDPRTRQVIRSLATPAPSATGDDYLAAGPGLLWVFRGPRLCQLNPATDRIIASARVDPIAPAFYSPAVIAGQNLRFLAQTSHGTALDTIAPAR